MQVDSGPSGAARAGPWRRSSRPRPGQTPQVRFAKVETDASPRASTSHRIRSIPTLVLFRQGREVARQTGAMRSAGLLAWLSAQLR